MRTRPGPSEWRHLAWMHQSATPPSARAVQHSRPLSAAAGARTTFIDPAGSPAARGSRFTRPLPRVATPQQQVVKVVKWCSMADGPRRAPRPASLASSRTGAGIGAVGVPVRRRRRFPIAITTLLGQEFGCRCAASFGYSSMPPGIRLQLRLQLRSSQANRSCFRDLLLRLPWHDFLRVFFSLVGSTDAS
jgi:hypothetical protein